MIPGQKQIGGGSRVDYADSGLSDRSEIVIVWGANNGSMKAMLLANSMKAMLLAKGVKPL